MYATKRQARLMREAVAALRKRPKKFDMATYFDHRDGCGTTCCFAGQICLNAGLKPVKTRDGWSDTFWFSGEVENGKRTHARVAASDILGLNVTDAEYTLFLDDHWPSIFHEQYVDAQESGNYLGMVEALHCRVEYFIATGK